MNEETKDKLTTLRARVAELEAERERLKARDVRLREALADVSVLAVRLSFTVVKSAEHLGEIRKVCNEALD